MTVSHSIEHHKYNRVERAKRHVAVIDRKGETNVEWSGKVKLIYLILILINLSRNINKANNMLIELDINEKW